MFRTATITFAEVGRSSRSIRIPVFFTKSMTATWLETEIVAAVDNWLGRGGDDFRIIDWAWAD